MIGEPGALAGKSAIVTGGASGIGARTVEILRALGAEVAAVDKSFPSSESTREVRCDVADVAEIGASARRIGESQGVDILVNCAGIVGPKARVAELTEEAWDLVQSVAYASSKAAIESVTRILVGELAEWEVNVNAVAPGITATAIFGEDSDGDALTRRASQGASSNLFRRLAQPDDIAEVIAFLCLPESRQITGQVVHASAGSIV